MKKDAPKVIAENHRASLSENRRARFDYEILDKLEAGIELFGFEAKSAKTGHMQISGSHVVIRNHEAWLLNSQVPPYQPKNTPPDYDPGRTRRLLLHKSEISILVGKIREKLSIIPMRAYLHNNLVKIELGLARPRKGFDKRELLKKRTALREMRRID